MAFTKAEPPVALVDRNVDRHKTRLAATGYLNFLYSPLAQDLIAKHHYRPRNAGVAKKYADNFFDTFAKEVQGGEVGSETSAA